MNNDMKLYYDYTISPLGKLFYKTLWSQLSEYENKKVLDFGSGFGFTTNYLAQRNDVTAVEIDESIIEYSEEKKEEYIQIHGGIEEIMKIPDETFDFVTCHLVLEFVDNPEVIVKELIRVLKKGGTLSVVRHNKNGRIIQAVVQDYDLADATKLLEGGNSYSSAFGDIKYYSNADLLKLAGPTMSLEKVSGIRVLASLHNGEMQNRENWIDKMFDIECKLLEDQDYINIAYFNHLKLVKKT